MMNANETRDALNRRQGSYRLPIILTATLVGSAAHLAGAGMALCVGLVLLSEFALIVISLLP